MQKTFIYAATVFFCLGVSSAAQAQKTFESFEQTGIKWHDNFCTGTEIPLVGDFNGDGKADIATFTRGTAADVYVALSDGMKFNGNGILWNGNICKGTEIPLVGNFDGDKYDDIAIFTRGTTANVFVYLSTGTKFKSPDVVITTNPIGTIQTPWISSFCTGTEEPLVGDFDGDGDGDIARFTRGTTGDVYVALSDRTKFNAMTVKWHDNFCYGTETPLVGNFDGKGGDDIATFVIDKVGTRSIFHNVYVALSDGTKFNGDGIRWYSGIQKETVSNRYKRSGIPRVGDFNGDGKDDIANFTYRTLYEFSGLTVMDAALVNVAISNGTSVFTEYGGSQMLDITYDWANIPSSIINDFIALAGKSSDDNFCDIVVFTRGTAADVYVEKAKVLDIK